MRTDQLALLWILISFYSCNSKIQTYNSIDGIWQSIGSGWYLEILDSTRYVIYDVTSISCLPNRKGDLEEMMSSLTLMKDTLSLLKGVITYQFTRADKLPDLCITPLSKEKQQSPLYNFEVFAETVKEHYAFKELNQINWEKLYNNQKSKITENSSDAELYLILEETLEKLNDNHAYLEANEKVYNEIDQLKSSQELPAEEEHNPEYGDFQIAAMVVKNHLQEEMTKDSWLIQWGKLTDDIGYIQIKAMWLYADLDIPKSMIEKMGFVDAYVTTFHQMYEGEYIEKEVIGVRKIMDKVMADLSTMKSIVMDVRFNGGGQDAVSFEILSRFIQGKLQVATQQLRYGNQFSPTLPLYIQGVQNSYSKPVYVLTSPQTGSAAEAFSIATFAMDHVKRMGSPTSGAMSTALEKELPKGWDFSISNEIYMDNQGNCYENIGIPVDFDLQYPRDRQTFFRNVANDLEGDKQDILKAIEAINEKRD